MPDTTTKPIRVLIVEDEPDLMNLYRKLLTTAGYTVEHTDNGVDALALLQKGGYDLALLDIMLPKMDGLQVLEELKKKPAAVENKAIVLLTNLNQDDVIAKAVEYNLRGYLVKSDYTPDKFLAEIRSILHHDK